MTAYDTSPFLPALPAGHAFPVEKYRRLRDAVQRAGLPVRLRAAPRAHLGWVLAVHDAHYVGRVLAGTLTAAEQRRLGLPWSRALAERALRICGAAVAACQDALDLGVGLVLGGGGHHADRASGRGFCVFNDLAVVARWARANGVGRVLVVDCDVHQGDGTASLLRHDPGVFTLSVHAAGNRPFGPVGSDLDVALPHGCGDREYLGALQDALVWVLGRFQPELVLYVAGADPLRGDRLGRLALSAEGLRTRDRMVLALARRAAAAVVVTLGGGYAEPVERAVQVHLGTVREVVRSAAAGGLAAGTAAEGGEAPCGRA